MSGFEERLKKVRARTGLSQPELAQKVGVDKSYISKLERGVESPPSRKVAVKLANSLGMPNRPVMLYVSPQDITALERFVFLLEANAAGAEDVKGIRIVEVEDVKDVDDEAEDDDFTFGSPLKTPQRRSDESDEAAQLRQLLAQVDALRATIEALIAEKEQQHGRTNRP
jgi:transcriptional regulator with XRE-family HTH domain